MIVYIDVDEALREFPQLLDRAHAGEEFVISRAGRPLARLISPDTQAVQRRPGRLDGRCGKEFDDVLPRDELAAWDATAPRMPE